MVKWELDLANGETISGLCSDGSWKNVQSKLAELKTKATGMRLVLDKHSVTIDKNKPGYFMGQKLIVTMPMTKQSELVGIGYLDPNKNKVRIKWYNASDLVLQNTEVKEPSDCEMFLIQQPSD